MFYIENYPYWILNGMLHLKNKAIDAVVHFDHRRDFKIYIFVVGHNYYDPWTEVVSKVINQ